jgi:hypothetical protein
MPARTATSAVSRIPVLMAGGERCDQRRLFAFFGLPIPSLSRSQFNPSTRASYEWQLAQLCQLWKQSVASLNHISPRRSAVSFATGPSATTTGFRGAAPRLTISSVSEK